jgi:thioesterase domain-containing protein
VRIDPATNEILIRGANVFAGYENDDSANSECFQDGWFRTGDLGHFDSEGYLFITGRLKEIINRGGLKVAPREVEEALLRNPAVAEAAVFALPDPRLGEEIGAAIVLHPGQSGDPHRIRRAAAEQLAPWKTPARVWIVPALPKGPTGKIPRVGLAQRLGLALAEAALSVPYVPPSTPAEVKLAAIWSEVLRREPIGVEDDFYQLGGDSFAVNVLLSAIEERLGVGGELLERIAFFDSPTIATLARLLETQRSGETSSSAPGCFVDVGQGTGSGPLFAFPGAAELLDEIAQLARHLQGVRVLGYYDPTPLAGRGNMSIESVAGRSIAGLRAVQPEGPYHLIGYCYGGLLAWEIAQQLSAQGDAVACLALVDTPAPDFPRFVRHFRHFAAEAFDRLTRAHHRGDILQAVRWHVQRQAERLRDRRRAEPPPSAGPSIDDVNIRAMRVYRGRPYAGPVIHFAAAAAGNGSRLDRRNGWPEYCTGRYDLVWVDASHDDIMGSRVASQVAELLCPYLASGSTIG